jgi:long-chain acyl-CoA synthetase
MPTTEEADAQVYGPGAPFEMQREDVLGSQALVFKNRLPSLRAMLEASAAHGKNDYLVFAERRISYARHAELVASIAKALQEDYGVGKGDRVAILAANRPEWILTFWATVSLGAIAVGLNGWWTRDEILFGLRDSDPTVLVADARRLERLNGTDLAMPVIEMETGFAALETTAGDTALPSTPIAEDDPALILYTSGTTGQPKGAVVSHRNIIGFVAINSATGFRNFLLNPPAADSPPNCMYVTNPLFHVSGLHAAAVMALAAGLKTVWNTGRFDAERTMATIEREKCTSWGAMNTVLHRIMEHPKFADFDLSSLTQVGGGGAPTPPVLQRRIRDAFPSLSKGNLGHGYGSTESGALATTIGGAEPTIEVEIRDDEGGALPEGQEGEIFVHGPLVMLEYWRRPGETAETIRDGRWLRMGDWGCIKDGRLFLAARRSDLILRASENVYPVEIENRIVEHPAVDETAVVGVPHEELGQEVKAFVVCKQGLQVSAEELAKFTAEKLAYFKVPAHWEFREKALPRNATGKVLKQVLTGEAESRFVEE